MTDEKKFGLVIPKKIDAFIKKKSVFEDDSDEDENVYKRPKIPQKKLESKNKLNINLAEDPSIYEYDDIYDEMKRKQTEIIVPKEKKNSRYIETLLKAAEKRKKEYERRIDRKIQVEREKEGDKYKDKEAFVTSSYKKKMLEQEEEEEKERRKNILNDMMDVTKQEDLSGFYRHFLKQTVGEEKIPQFGGKQIKDVVNDEDSSDDQKNFENNENVDQDSDNVESDDNKSPENDGKLHAENQKVFSGCEIQNMKQSSSKSESKTSHSKKRSRKHYRKSKKSPNFRSSSSEEDGNLYNDKNNLLCTSKKSDKNLLNSRHDSCSSDDDDDKLNGKSADTDDCSKDRKEKNFKIFAKRTIGNNFTEAQARYFQRMTSQKAEI